MDDFKLGLVEAILTGFGKGSIYNKVDGTAVEELAQGFSYDDWVDVPKMVEAITALRSNADLVFMECDTCRALPGSPPLCRGCLHNRTVIARLRRRD